MLLLLCPITQWRKSHDCSLVDTHRVPEDLLEEMPRALSGVWDIPGRIHGHLDFHSTTMATFYLKMRRGLCPQKYVPYQDPGFIHIGRDTTVLFSERKMVHMTHLSDICIQTKWENWNKADGNFPKAHHFWCNGLVIFRLWTLEITSCELATYLEVQEWQTQIHKPALPFGFWTLPEKISGLRVSKVLQTNFTPIGRKHIPATKTLSETPAQCHTFKHNWTQFEGCYLLHMKSNFKYIKAGFIGKVESLIWPTTTVGKDRVVLVWESFP